MFFDELNCPFSDPYRVQAVFSFKSFSLSANPLPVGVSAERSVLQKSSAQEISFRKTGGNAA